MAPNTSPLPAEVVYVELRAHHGRMHDTMYAMPPSFGVVIGALWYFAGDQLKNNASFIAAIVFAFTAVITRFLFDAYSTFAKRTEELRIHIQDTFESTYKFDNDYRPPRPDLRYRTYVLGPLKALLDWLRFLFDNSSIAMWRDQELTEREKLTQQADPLIPKGRQKKTREEFRKVMRTAGWLSIAGTFYSLSRWLQITRTDMANFIWTHRILDATVVALSVAITVWVVWSDHKKRAAQLARYEAERERLRERAATEAREVAKKQVIEEEAARSARRLTRIDRLRRKAGAWVAG